MFVVLSAFLARTIPFRELDGFLMKIVEYWDNVLVYVVESGQAIDITGRNATSV